MDALSQVFSDGIGVLATVFATVFGAVVAYFVLPYVWDFLKRYQSFVLFSVFFTIAFALVSDYVALVIYHFVVAVVLGFSQFVTFDTVKVVLYEVTAVFLFVVYSMARPWFSK